MLVVWTAGTIVALLLTVKLGAPAPKVHDEFAYLLGADTFASGRVTNPTHPMWQHFESYHVIHQPSYNCKYPPAQSLTLAAGKLMGHPIIGSCLATGVSLAALVWMLTGWLPRKYNWAICLFAILHPGFQTAWGQSYWGGAVALTGGAMLLGALIRVNADTQTRYSVIAAIGAILLANSRPLEGAILTASVGGALVWRFATDKKWKCGSFLLRTVAPAAAVVCGGVGLMLAYNNRVTGDPITMPYQVHESTYGWNPVFLWQTPGEKPDYRHAEMEFFFTCDMQQTKTQFQSLADVVRIKSRHAFDTIVFFCGGTITLAVFGVPWLVRRPRYRLAILLAAPAFAASLVTPWKWPHYCAPAAPTVILLGVAGMLELWKRAQPVPVARVAILAVILVSHLTWWSRFENDYCAEFRHGWADERSNVLNQLLSSEGRDLVLVRYSGSHDPNAEWVYNDADIDRSPVVWAREMSCERREALISYFDDRHVWVLEADKRPPELRPFQPDDTL